MREIHLVGVNHKYQFGRGRFFLYAPAEAIDEFEGFLRAAIAKRDIRGIAEEMSQAALNKHSIASSIPCRVAAEIGLPHRYCDPEPDTQKTLKITSDDNERRERYWIKELLTFDRFPVLFVLGADHVEGFERLLIESGLQRFVIARNWEPLSGSSERD